ncbi:MAG TPA: M24 family metallopeptidase [Spirillospora sp.]|nr:M24 family metallopeptidase [Spirillospora sp.]
MTDQRFPGFSLAERDRRWTLACTIMEAEGVGALIAYGEHECTDPAPFAPDVYFSNDRPGAIVVFVRDAEPVSLVWSTMSVCDHATSSERGDAVWIRPENMRVGKSAAGIVEVLREHGLESGPVGVLGLEPYPPWHIFDPVMSYPMWASVREQLPEATFKPLQLSYYMSTVGLSDEEQACVRYAASVGDEMAKAMLAEARPGATEGDLCAAAMAAALRRGCHAPKPLMFTGPGFAAYGPPPWAYRPQPPRVLRDGDVVITEVFNKYAMYESQSQVAIAIGEVHPDILEAEGVARAAYEAGLAAARPGSAFGDVIDAMTAPVRASRGWQIHPMAHGMNPYGMVGGFGSDLAERWPAAERYGKLAVVPTVAPQLPLTPGMSFSFEPSCVIDGKVCNIGGTVLIGEDGPIELNAYTARILHA